MPAWVAFKPKLEATPTEGSAPTVLCKCRYYPKRTCASVNSIKIRTNAIYITLKIL